MSQGEKFDGLWATKTSETVSGADMDPKQAPVQEVVTRVKMPLLVVGNRTGMWPHAAGAVVDDEDNVDDEYSEDGDG